MARKLIGQFKPKLSTQEEIAESSQEIHDEVVRSISEDFPEDKKLTALLIDAYRGKLLVRMTLIKIDGIKPFSDYAPSLNEAYQEYFEALELEGTPPPIYVYPKDDFFIMSDDYNAYNMYLRKKYKELPCILLGDSKSAFIVEKSEPFKLPMPEVTEI